MKMNARSVPPPGARLRLQDRRREATIQALVEATEQVIAESGYEGATMQGIARRAGCAAGTLYLYFKSKEDLFHAMVTRHVKEITERAEKVLSDPNLQPIERMRGAVSQVITYFNENRAFFRVFYTALPGGRARLQSNLRGEALDVYLAAREQQITVMKQAQAAGQARRDLPASELVDFIHAVNVVTFARWATEARIPSLKEQIDLLWALHSGGVCGGKARP